MRIKRIFNAVRSYLIFFILTAFITTCSVMLIMNSLIETIGYGFSKEQLAKSAKVTFINVLFIALFFTLIDFFRRRITVDSPAKKIEKCLSLLTEGDFSARVEKIHKNSSYNRFDKIAEDINRLAEELEGVEMLRNDFISNVSHEIKTPLSVIQNYAMLLSSPSLDEKEKAAYAEKISEGSRKLARLVTDILRLNRLENQTIYYKKEVFDLSEEICSSLLSFEDIWNSKEISLSTEIEQGINIDGDKDLMSLIWNNLFSNAFKFTPRYGEVKVKLKLYGDKAMLIVSDTGCGMDSKTIHRIWDKFYQGDTSHTQEGNGLGLSLVKRIVSICDGTIEVESRINKGSTFIVTLPYSSQR